MKCCVIFVLALLVVLLAEASAAPPRTRQLLRRSYRVRHLVPKYALRRSWQDNPDCTPSSADVIVAGNLSIDLYTRVILANSQPLL